MKQPIVYGKVILIAVLAVIITRSLLVTSCFIPSTGMENTLYKDEGVLVNKWSYGLRLPLQSVVGYHRLLAKPVGRGDIVVFNNPMPADTSKAVEFREIYISRCIGIPGDTLLLNNELLSADAVIYSPDSKSLYSYPSLYEEVVVSVLSSLDINDNQLAGYTPEGDYIRSFSNYEYYLVSQRMGGRVKFTQLETQSPRDSTSRYYPFLVPRKGIPVKFTPWNTALLCNMITYHEKKKVRIVEGCTDNDSAEKDSIVVYVDNKPVTEYTFSQDFFWMASNDPVNTTDSRLFGFVPENHIIGKASRIWYPARKGRFMQRVQ